MKTNNRTLTYLEQEILRYELSKNKLNQTMIAEMVGKRHPTEINRVCSGLYAVTPHWIEVFKAVGIDLEFIMNFKGVKKNNINARILTPKERKELNRIIRENNLSKNTIIKNAMTSPYVIYGICNGKYKVSNLMKEHFLKSGIDLNEIMED